jgi:ParB-like chromosome segregation protein Spo0J
MSLFNFVSNEEILIQKQKIEDVKNILLPILNTLNDKNKIEIINELKEFLHNNSPFKNEPVDCVLWVNNEIVTANDYNPNSVAPPEMELLKVSILADGFTQPIVTFPEENKITVIDGFHRNRVGKEDAEVKKRVLGYLPIVKIRQSQEDKCDRIASTIRHNRARGKHKVEGMTDIVIELKKRNWSNERISKNLGMDTDEILRLCQISGISEVFSNSEFSESWDAEIYKDEDFKFLSEEDIKEPVKEQKGIKRILHTWDKWECYKAGFYEEQPPAGFTNESAEIFYKDFLSDLTLFEENLKRVIAEWKFSCEHYLTNENMNRIAWLGQASVCIYKGIPARYRGGYNLLSEEQKQKADLLALKYLNIWLIKNNYPIIEDIKNAESKTEANLY